MKKIITLSAAVLLAAALGNHAIAADNEAAQIVDDSLTGTEKVAGQAGNVVQEAGTAAGNALTGAGNVTERVLKDVKTGTEKVLNDDKN